MQAAYAHYGLVVIHPFPDGNGRVARALASAFTYRAIAMPIMILSEHKEAYLDALESADIGEYQRFVGFMQARSFDTIQLVFESMGGVSLPTPEESLAAIQKLYFTKGGFTQKQVDDLGMKFAGSVFAEVSKEVGKYGSPRVQGSANLGGASYSGSQTHRPPHSGGHGFSVSFNSTPPLVASVGRRYNLLVPKDAGGEDDFLLTQSDRRETFSARVDEIKEGIAGVLQIRVSIFAERIVREMLAELSRQAERNKRQQV